MHTPLLILGMTLSVASRAFAADWPQYKRDAARTGDQASEVLRPPMSCVTAVRFPAPIYASPAVVGGKVFVQDAHGHVACIDAKNGNRIVWQGKLDGVNNQSSPAVVGGKVFVGSSGGYLAILDAADGELLTKVPADGAVIAAPAATDGAVYFVSLGGSLYKIDFDGKLLWSLKVAPAIHVEFAVRGDTIAVLSSHAHVIKDRGASGEAVGSAGAGVCPTGGPAFLDDDRFAWQGFDSEGGLMSVVRVSGTKVSAIPAISDLNDSRATPSTRDGLIYRGDRCFAGPDKRQTWKADCPALQPGGFHSSPALSKDVQVVGAEDGNVYFVALPEAGGPIRKPVWAFQTRGGKREANRAVSSSPAISGGRVFFGGEDGILYGLGEGRETALDDILPGAASQPESPAAALPAGRDWPTAGGDMGFSGVSDETIRPPFRIRWKTRIWSTCKAPAIVAAGKVFVAGRMGQLTALDARTGEILWRTHHGYGESRPAPTVADGKVLVLRAAVDQAGRANPSGGLWCHDAQTGKLLWRRELPIGYGFNADGAAAHDGNAFACWNAGGGAIKAAAFRLTDGEFAWHKEYKGLLPVEQPPSARPAIVRHASAIGDGRVYFGVAASETLARKKSIKGPFGAVFAASPGNGDLLWKNTDYSLVRGSRISYRRGIVAVFSADGTHALDATTGKLLWDSKPPSEPLYFGHYYWQPLSDTFLDSKGQQGVCGYIGCSFPVFVGGVWYGHAGNGSPFLAGFEEGPVKAGSAFTPKDIWRYRFLSRSCPSPAPAYGRLYHTPNGEGVVYCFEPEAMK